MDAKGSTPFSVIRRGMHCSRWPRNSLPHLTSTSWPPPQDENGMQQNASSSLELKSKRRSRITLELLTVTSATCFFCFLTSTSPLAVGIAVPSRTFGSVSRNERLLSPRALAGSVWYCLLPSIPTRARLVSETYTS